METKKILVTATQTEDLSCIVEVPKSVTEDQVMTWYRENGSNGEFESDSCYGWQWGDAVEVSEAHAEGCTVNNMAAEFPIVDEAQPEDDAKDKALQSYAEGLAAQPFIDSAERAATPAEIAQSIMDTTRPADDSNVRRATRAFQTLAPEYDDDTLSTGISDLLTDLRHLCDLAGFDLAELDSLAHRAYQQELADCGGVAVHADFAEAIKSEME